jgi:hypothetical protein
VTVESASTLPGTTGYGEATAVFKVDDLRGRIRGVATPLLATWRAAATQDVLHIHVDSLGAAPTVNDHMVLDDLDGRDARVRRDPAVAQGLGPAPTFLRRIS